MAQLALGIAGAAIGSLFGFPALGFAIGSAVGSVLFAPPAPDGPRVNDKKLQVSQYGQMIPLVWGRQRLAGQVIDQTDLVEHSHESSGKGQSGPTTYTYTASFAVALCERVSGTAAITGLLRIWADGRIIYDTTGTTSVDNSKIPITIYRGTEDQMPDPTFEAIHGVGNVSAYRSYAYVVFTDWDLGEYYNRIPNLEIEVFTTGGDIPWRVSEWDVPLTPGHNQGRISGAIVGGSVVIAQWDYLTMKYWTKTYTIDGDEIATSDVVNMNSPSWGGNVQYFEPCQNNPHIAIARDTIGPGSAWYVDGGIAVAGPLGFYLGAAAPPFFYNDNIFVGDGTSSGVTAIHRYPVTGGIPSGSPNASWSVPGATTAGVGITVGDGFVYVLKQGPTDTELYRLDTDLNLLETWTNSDFPIELAGAATIDWAFTVKDGNIFLATTDGGNDARLYTLTHPLVFVNNAEVDVVPGFCPLIDLGNGLVLTNDGILSLTPPPTTIQLKDIVGPLCERGNLASSQYDVSELVDEVTGFKISQQATLRTAIESLIPGYAFAAVERDVLIAFPKLGADPVVTITEDDLAAADYGSEQPPPRDYTHGHDDDLPRQVTVVYQEEDANYQPGSQQAQRQVGNSTSFVAIELPVATNAIKARNVAEINLLRAHVERDKYKCTTSRKYLWLEPTDVVGLIDRAVLLQNKTHTPSGLLTWNGVANVGQIFVPTGTGAPGEGFSAPSARPSQSTDLILLDIPLLSTNDNESALYVAMVGALFPTWVGAQLHKSTDGGATYASVLTDSVPETIGRTSTALGDFTGGNVFDETNSVTLQLSAGSGTIATATELAVLNGANLAAIGDDGRWELIRFKRATLVGTRTYTLSGLLRGRYGTEWAMDTHTASDRFVLLPTSSQVPVDPSEIYAPRLYKAVTNGQAVATAVAVSMTSNAIAMKPLSPVHLGGGRNGAGDVTLNWTPRSRKSGGGLGTPPTPIAEDGEGYFVRLYTDGTYAASVASLGTSSATLTVTATELTTLFGSPPATMYWGVWQLGTIGDGYEARAAT